MIAQTIEEVISILDGIIQESKTNNTPLGYFAALYKKVTLEVKKGIEENFFDDNERMEKLDVIFANRYLKAYYNYQNNLTTSLSWEKAFAASENYWPIVLQHLLLGMNAHINLDLGIAAYEVSIDKDLHLLKNDFNKINTILSSLVSEVEEELSTIWPKLKSILRFTKKVDDFLVDFSMEIARDGAWEFAELLYNSPKSEIENIITNRDLKVSQKASIITNPGLIPSSLFVIIRIGEKGSVSDKIQVLNS